ncbi:M15 family metallopeptidase [Romboutsia sp.]|uniref:M15 family metallopeptidase n=1 Tax=Romboutsia sp. TaxID=1965302 RepID=UPI003F2CA16A
MSTSLDTLHPYVKQLALKFLEKCKAENFPVQITYTFRSIKEQNDLYAKGRTTKGPKVTNARGGYSYHNYGLAFDASPLVNGKIDWNNESLYKKMGAIGKSVGLDWGGDWKNFKDMPHFQWTGGLLIEELVRGKRPIAPGGDTVKVDSMKLLKFDSVKAFQEKMGLGADGVVGGKTKGAIDEIMKKPTLRKGDKGFAVRYLQFRLGLAVDGDFGSKTEEALRKWQIGNKLLADGVCGSKSWDVLI